MKRSFNTVLLTPSSQDELNPVGVTGLREKLSRVEEQHEILRKECEQFGSVLQSLGDVNSAHLGHDQVE